MIQAVIISLTGVTVCHNNMVPEELGKRSSCVCVSSDTENGLKLFSFNNLYLLFLFWCYRLYTQAHHISAWRQRTGPYDKIPNPCLGCEIRIVQSIPLKVSNRSRDLHRLLQDSSLKVFKKILLSEKRSTPCKNNCLRCTTKTTLMKQK